MENPIQQRNFSALAFDVLQASVEVYRCLSVVDDHKKEIRNMYEHFTEQIQKYQLVGDIYYPESQKSSISSCIVLLRILRLNHLYF